MTLGKNRYSKKVTKEEFESLSRKIILHNKKPNDRSKDQIISILITENKEIIKVKALKQNTKKKIKEAGNKKSIKEKVLDNISKISEQEEAKVEDLVEMVRESKQVEEPKPELGNTSSGGRERYR